MVDSSLQEMEDEIFSGRIQKVISLTFLLLTLNTRMVFLHLQFAPMILF